VRRYFAHENQNLKGHLINVANLAGNFGKKFGAENCAYVAGLLHDFGKYTAEYQDYLDKSINGEKTYRGDVIHAFQGAKYILDNINIKEHLIKDILANPIAAHHGGLYDNTTNDEKILLKKTENEVELHYQECKKAFEIEFDKLPNFELCQNEIIEFIEFCKSKEINICFMLHLFTKAIYSCLIDADRCDSARFEIENKIPNWSKYLDDLEKKLNEKDHLKKLNRIREKISTECKKAGAKEQGIYFLSIPTGGGKTLASLRFALEHAKEHNLEHIIYVIPYLSILDQNAKIISDILGEENILEHHSNLDLSDDENEEHRLLTSRWDSPIILTTMVQFLESIYSNKASKLRKFHNMAKSVFIFDEYQSLPIKCMHLFNDAINFLHFFGKSTILLCSATKSPLHRTERPIKMSNNSEIISLSEDEQNCFIRTKIKQSSKNVLELIKEQINANKNTLVILNTKETAREIFEQCKNLKCEKAFLTTDLCPAHRLKVLEKLRNNLEPTNKKLSLCISTQLIEAGVDISFDCVIRACAGMDSIVQAAGRCNREGDHSEPQDVFVVDIDNEKLDKLDEIKEGKHCTERVFREKNDIDIGKYYDYYYSQKDIKNKMDYFLVNTSIYNLLNTNDLNFKGRPLVDGLPASFKIAAENFSVIDKQKTGIVVPFDEYEVYSIVEKFKNEPNPKEKYQFLRKLQKYTISVYSDTLKRLLKEKAIYMIDNAFYILNSGFYDENTGLLLQDKFPFLSL